MDGGGGNVKSAGPLSSPTSRSDDGAGGVVETTLAAAAQPQPQPQRYSPFLLQNRTGLRLEFWAHQDKVDRCDTPLESQLSHKPCQAVRTKRRGGGRVMVRLPNGLFGVCHAAVNDVMTDLSRSVE